MLENPSEKILLLSDHSHDASFLSEIAIAQQAALVVVENDNDLCTKIAQFRNDDQLVAIFVDVTEPDSMRKFEFALQSKLGVALALDLTPMVHYISGDFLSLNREILQSPYFSFYSERKPFDFSGSAKVYENSFIPISEIHTGEKQAFDSKKIEESYQFIKSLLLAKDVSAEWVLRLRKTYLEIIESLFPARFDLGYSFMDGMMRFVFESPFKIDREKFKPEKFLEMGISSSIGSNAVVLFVPIFLKLEQARETFRFYKIERP